MNTIQKIFLIGLIPFMFFIGCEEEESLPYVDLNWIKYHSSSGNAYVYYRGDISPPSSLVDYKCLWIHLYKAENYFEYHKVGSDNSHSKDVDGYSTVTYD